MRQLQERAIREVELAQREVMELRLKVESQKVMILEGLNTNGLWNGKQPVKGVKN
jgi:hypothetical protein